MRRAQNTVKRGTFWPYRVVGGRGGGSSLLRRGENCRTAMPRPGGPWPDLRAAAPAADPGKMGKEETARLTFPICVCRVVYVCLYVYTLSSLCSLLYNIASLQTKKQASRKNVFFPTFSAFSISHQLTCCCCC